MIQLDNSPEREDLERQIQDLMVRINNSLHLSPEVLNEYQPWFVTTLGINTIKVN